MFPVLVALIPAIFITRSKFFQENFSNKFGRFFSAYVLSYLAVQVLVLVISGTYIASMFAGVFFKDIAFYLIILILTVVFIYAFQKKIEGKYLRFLLSITLAYVVTAGSYYAYYFLLNFRDGFEYGYTTAKATTDAMIEAEINPTKTPQPVSTKKPTAAPSPSIKFIYENFLRMPDSVKGSDNNAFSETADIFAQQLNIPKPYAYKWYLVSKSVSPASFTAYYKPRMREIGLAFIDEINNSNGVRILIYKKSDRYYAIKYNPASGVATPSIWIFQWENTPASISLPEDAAFNDYLFMPGVTLFTRDATTSKYVADHARNLAIPSPYSWEWVELPSQSTATDFVTYYKKTMPEHGYKTVYDLDDPNGLYLLKFQKGNEIYAMLFHPEYDGYKADVLIIRWIK